MEKLEVVQVNHGKVNDRISSISIIAKDEAGNLHEVAFLAKAHYMDSIKKTFSRMSPTKREVKQEVKDGQH